MNERHFNDVGEVLDYAIAREVEAYEFYRDLATRVKAAKLREVLLGFAAEEVEHKVLLERAKAGDVEIGREEVVDLGLANEIEDVEIREAMSYREALGIAIKKEDRSVKLYLGLARWSQSEKVREMFLRLAKEEAGHRLRFEFEYDLVSF